MITSGKWFFVALFGALILAYLALMLQFFAGRVRLGAVLWAAANSGDVKWFPLFWFVLGVFRVAEVVHYLGKDPSHALLSGLMAAGFMAVGVLNSKPMGSLRVHEGGISTGFLILPWGQVSGWAFRPDEGRKELVSLFARDYTGSVYLYLWTPSLWRFFYSPIPSRPLKTSVANEAQLVALLARYAPDREPQTSATV